MDKFKLIMLIDDDEATNFYHKIILGQADICEEFRFFTSPKKALEYLSNLQTDDSLLSPDVIFLDINMPGINGWDFLDAFGSIPMKTAPTIVMLTTSINPQDREKAESHNLIHSFIIKTLTAEHLYELRDQLLVSEN